MLLELSKHWENHSGLPVTLHRWFNSLWLQGIRCWRRLPSMKSDILSRRVPPITLSMRNLLLRFTGAPSECRAFVLSLSGPMMTDIHNCICHMSVSCRLLIWNIRLFKIGGLTKWEFPLIYEENISADKFKPFELVQEGWNANVWAAWPLRSTQAGWAGSRRGSLCTELEPCIQLVFLFVSLVLMCF